MSTTTGARLAPSPRSFPDIPRKQHHQNLPELSHPAPTTAPTTPENGSHPTSHKPRNTAETSHPAPTCDSHLGLPPATPTNVRTDGLTENPKPPVDLLALRHAREHKQIPTPISTPTTHRKDH